MLKSFPIAVAGAAILLAGCSADNLYIAHKTNLGLNGSYNQAKPSGKFILGYKEQFITVIPKSVPLSTEAQGELNTKDETLRDAMSILSCSDVKVGFLELREYSEYLATGTAARLHARALLKGGPAAAQLLAFKLRDKIDAAAAAVKQDASAPPSLEAELTAARTKLNEAIDGPAETLAPSLALLQANELKTAIASLTASTNAAVNDAGLQLKAVQRDPTINATGQLDSRIFSCFKNPEKA
jgi:hypothetical protein